MEQQITESIELGTWLGRGQAFGVIANGCTAAQAECLRQIRDSGTYKQTGLTWDEFCERYVALTRPRVDALINNLEEFGKAFFDLSNVVRISPEAYRKIQKKIKDQSIEIGAELVPIIPENAARIRRAVHDARKEAKRAWTENRAMKADTNILMSRLEDIFEQLDHKAGYPLISKSEHETLTFICEYIHTQTGRVERSLEDSPKAPTREDD